MASDKDSVLQPVLQPFLLRCGAARRCSSRARHGRPARVSRPRARPRSTSPPKTRRARPSRSSGRGSRSSARISTRTVRWVPRARETNAPLRAREARARGVCERDAARPNQDARLRQLEDLRSWLSELLARDVQRERLVQIPTPTFFIVRGRLIIFIFGVRGYLADA